MESTVVKSEKGTTQKHIPSFKNFEESSKFKLGFQLVGTRYQYANTLRRLIEAEVETVGFRCETSPETISSSDIKIKHNDTSMTNETLAHRISLIPINVQNPIGWTPETAEKYLFVLNVSGNKDTYRDITCADFEIRKKKSTGTNPIDSNSAEKDIDYEIIDNKIFFPGSLQKFLIIILDPGVHKKLIFTAKATLGSGKEHARFRPTCLCGYKYTLDNDPKNIKQYFTQWLSVFKKAGHITDETSEEYKQYQREFNTMERNRVYLKNDKDEPFSFDFEIESIGILSVIYIVKRALEIGMEMVKKYIQINPISGGDAGSILPALDGLGLSIVPVQDKKMEGYDFIFENQDYTLGNLLQTWLVDNLVSLDYNKKPTESNPVIRFAGFHVPHPLENKMVLTIGCSDEFTARRAVVMACRGVHGMLLDMGLKWVSITK